MGEANDGRLRCHFGSISNFDIIQTDAPRWEVGESARLALV